MTVEATFERVPDLDAYDLKFVRYGGTSAEEWDFFEESWVPSTAPHDPEDRTLRISGAQFVAVQTALGRRCADIFSKGYDAGYDAGAIDGHREALRAAP